MISNDLSEFKKTDLKHRLLHGGLPPFWLANNIVEKNFQEWLDSFWAKDIQELFRLEKRYTFQKFTELLFRQSSGLFEATRFAAPCEVSRNTICNYLTVLEATFLVHVIRPFSQKRNTEIVSAPKVYAFDTGFICTYNGWFPLRDNELGLLWEHFILNELYAHLQTRNIRYWQDKRQHEIDFILLKSGHAPIAIECKWSLNSFEPRNILSFRKQYPEGLNYVVVNKLAANFKKQYQGVIVNFVNLTTFIKEITCIFSNCEHST